MRRSRSGRAKVSARGASAATRASAGMGNAPRNSFSGITFFAMRELYSGCMAERPTERIAVILRRDTLEGRWADHAWDLHAVVPDIGGEPRTAEQDAGTLLRVFPGHELVL